MRSKSGVTLLEYAGIAAVIALLIMMGMSTGST
jgi:Flp pilus assembly pilin Flp